MSKAIDTEVFVSSEGRKARARHFEPVRDVCVYLSQGQRFVPERALNAEASVRREAGAWGERSIVSPRLPPLGR